MAYKVFAYKGNSTFLSPVALNPVLLLHLLPLIQLITRGAIHTSTKSVANKSRHRKSKLISTPFFVITETKKTAEVIRAFLVVSKSLCLVSCRYIRSTLSKIRGTQPEG